MQAIIEDGKISGHVSFLVALLVAQDYILASKITV